MRVTLLRTFHQRSVFGGLAVGENGFDENAHLAFRRVRPSHDAETQRFMAGALVERDRRVHGAHGVRGRRPRRASVHFVGQHPVDDGHGVLFAL